MKRFRRIRLLALGSLRWILLLVALAYLSVRLVDWIVLEPLVAVAENEARDKGIDAINRIVLTSLSKAKYEDMVVYEKDQEGRVAAYHVKTWHPKSQKRC